MNGMQPFNEPKPTFIAPLIEATPKRNWAMEPKKKAFGPQLANQIEQFAGRGKSDVDAKTSINFATMVAASLQKSWDHMPLYVLSFIEQMGEKSNSERVNDPGFQDYREKLKTNFYQPNLLIDEQLEDDDDDDDDSNFFENIEDVVPGEGHTFPHNLNIYHGASSLNPFKKEDKGYTEFEESEDLAMYRNGFMSPLRALEENLPGFWKEINDKMNNIQHSGVRKDVREISPFNNPWVNEDDKDLNWENAADPFFDNEVENFDINANYHTIIESKIWKTWEQDEVVAWMVRRWSDVKRFGKSIRTFSGRAYDVEGALPKFQTGSVQGDEAMDFLDKQAELDLEVAKEITNFLAEMDDALVIPDDEDVPDDQLATKTQLDAFDQEVEGLEDILKEIQDKNLRTNVEKVLKKGVTGYEYDVQKAMTWWEQIGTNLPNEGMLLPFGLMSEIMGDVSKEMDFGNWENKMTSRIGKTVKDKKGGFMDKMISGYLDFIKKDHIVPLKGSGNLRKLAFASEGEAYSLRTFNTLHQNGFITKAGAVTSKFDPLDPNFDLGISANKQENDRVAAILRQAAIGSMNLDVYDNTRVNGQKRKIIQITDPYGDTTSLPDVLDWVGKGETMEEQYSNTRKAYNVFFDVYESLAQVNLKDPGKNGDIVLEKTAAGFEATVYPNGSWQQWSPGRGASEVAAATAGGWEKIEKQPVKITFTTEAEANAFFDKVKGVVAILEPLLASFDPVHNAGPGMKSLTYEEGKPTDSKLRVITDNEGDVVNGQIVQYRGLGYQVQVDYVHHQTYFQTEKWQNVADYVGQKAVNEIGMKIFEKAQVNRFSRLNHRRKKTEYKEKKKQHEEREYDRLISEAKARGKRLREKKRMKASAHKAYMKHMAALKQAAARSAKISSIKKSSRKKPAKKRKA